MEAVKEETTAVSEATLARRKAYYIKTKAIHKIRNAQYYAEHKTDIQTRIKAHREEYRDELNKRRRERYVPRERKPRKQRRTKLQMLEAKKSEEEQKEPELVNLVDSIVPDDDADDAPKKRNRKAYTKNERREMAFNLKQNKMLKRAEDLKAKLQQKASA
jgi:hypothetical protein